MHHLERFFLVARLFDKYFSVKLKIFLGIFFCTVDQRLVVLREAYFRMDVMINPWEVSSSVIR